jgi:nucleoside transporter
MIGARLSAMMFLQFFIWGAWFVTTANFLGVRGGEEWNIGGTIYSLCPIAAMISPIFLGMVADRFFPTQRVLGVMHLLSGAVMCVVANHAGQPDASPDTYTYLLLAHALCYMPTLALSNTLAFHHVTNPAKQFPLIRVFGTLGWIAAGYVVSGWLGVDVSDVTIGDAAQQYWVAAIAAIVLGLFSFTMPHTPPPSAGKKVSLAESLGLGAVKLMAKPAFAIFIVASFLTCIPLMAYYAQAQLFVGQSGWEKPAVVMAYGQWVEVIFMLIMPLLFLRFGVKWMLAMGMLAWVVRYGLFSQGAGDTVADAVPWMILGGILLHGICYDFFFVTGQIYVDKVAPKAIRGQAQGFLVLMTLGLGSYFGSHVAHEIVQANQDPAAITMLEDAEKIKKRLEPYNDKAPNELSPIARMEVEIGTLEIKRLNTEAGKVRKVWKDIWLWPAAGALVILVLFVIFFRYRDDDEKETVEQAE